MNFAVSGSFSYLAFGGWKRQVTSPLFFALKNKKHGVNREVQYKHFFQRTGAGGSRTQNKEPGTFLGNKKKAIIVVPSLGLA